MAPLPSTPAGSVAFRVRPARRGDAEGLSALVAELGYPDGADMSTVHWVLSHPELEVLVAADGQDKPVGMLSLSHRPQLRLRGRVATIDELVVAPSWRRRGVGKALVNKAVDRARVLSAHRLDLVAEIGTNEALQAFAAACGFTEAPGRLWSLQGAELKTKK